MLAQLTVAVIFIAVFDTILIDDSHALESYARQCVLESEIHLLGDGLISIALLL